MSRVESARVVCRGFAAGHLLAAEHLAKRAKAARADDSSTDLVRANLQWQADSEDRVAGEFGTVADLLDPLDRAARA